MNEFGKPFSPAELIIQHHQKRQREVIPSLESDPAIEKIVKERVLQHVADQLKKEKPAVRTRITDIDEEVEGKVGYTPRSERLRAVREMIRGFTTSKNKIDEVERKIEIEEVTPVDTVRLHFFIDANPQLLAKPRQVRAMLNFLRTVNEISPAEINSMQDDADIKKVKVMVEVMVETVDGSRSMLLGEDLPTEELLTEYLALLQKTITLLDHSDHPRLNYSAKIADVYKRSHQIKAEEKKSPKNILHTHTLVFNHTTYHKGINFHTVVPYQVVQV